MFRNIKKVPDLKSFALSHETCLINTKKNVLDLVTNNILYTSEIGLLDIQFHGKFFVHDIFGKGIYFNDKIEAIETDYFIRFFEHNFIIYAKREGEIKNTYIENLDTGEFYKIESASTVHFQYQSLLWRKNFKNNSIETFSFPEAQPLWQFSIDQFGQYKKLYSPEMKTFELSNFLGVWEEELIVSCQGGMILSLNISTGDLIRKWDKLPEKADDNIKEVFRGGLQQSGHVYQLNLIGNKIIAIYYHHIIEIDLVTGEIDLKNLIESLQQYNISAFQLKSGYAEDETHYYTTVHFDREKLGLNYIPTAVCAINKISLNIDWFYRFDEDGTGDYVSIQVPQIRNGKLYQLTANNTLHIFQKT